MKTNAKRETLRTHEGATAKHINPEKQLKRSVISCLLWEDTFYESGQSIADRISEQAHACHPKFVAELAIMLRTEGKLRHAPLWLLIALVKSSGGKLVEDTVCKVIQRADELAELLALYWKDGKRPLPAAMKRGIAKAFNKFDAYQFAKYDRDGVIKLRDVMFLTHPKPKDEKQAEIFKQLAEGTLPRPDTWESRLTGGEDKKEAFGDLLKRGKLGYMALLRNLRGMNEAGVDADLIRKAILVPGKKCVLPFRYLSAAKHAPLFERALDAAMMTSLENHERMTGRTVMCVDVSGSMNSPVSGKSEITRADAACGLAILLSGICDDLRVIAFADSAQEVPARTGMALRDAIKACNIGYSTNMNDAKILADTFGYDRIIIISDEQTRQKLSDPKGTAWMINVATAQHGVGYGAWNHIDGFSEATIEYIQEYEKSVN